jgi:N-acetylglucosaminyl-diphospho-decaprenol L-rhamnosyltransferase
MPDVEPLAAVITVTHNSLRVMGDWLEAIAATGVRDRLELCVVDSGSRPEERGELIRRFEKQVDALLLRPNLGFGRGCNEGVAATRASVLIFVNPDTRLVTLPSALGGPWPDRTVFGPMNRINSGIIPMGFRHAPSAALQAVDMVLGRFSPVEDLTAGSPKWVSGGSFAITRADFERAGGFPSYLFLYFEDADLCLAHRRDGGRIAIDPHWIIEHEGGVATPELRDTMDTVARQSGRAYVRRHEGPVRAAMLYVLLAFVYVPRRVLGVLWRRARGRPTQRPAFGLALDLLVPSRVRRRLGAEP